MSKFGWSYPPGCNSVPGDEDSPCAVCGFFEDECICPECPECSAIGDPHCYAQDGGHGLVRTPQQIDSLAAHQERWRAEAEAEAAYWNARAWDELNERGIDG